MTGRVSYDEFGLFAENAAEYGLPFDRPPAVRRAFAEVADGRRLSALVWQEADAELVLLHGGSQNAHTWDTVAMALDRPLVAIDLPGHGHSDGPGDRPEGQLDPHGNAADVAAAIRQLAPAARAVIGMSLGGLTAIALAAEAPELVRKLVLVDVLPGIKTQRARHITDFVNGPASFASLDELLERTARFNPSRSRSSLRRGILHNAEQRPDGTWVWRWARHRRPGAASATQAAAAQEVVYPQLWDALSAVTVPVLLARGMRPDSVLDDDDERELLARLPSAQVEHVAEAGHSLQGDTPLELAAIIGQFVFGSGLLRQAR
ncbi:MAG: alpha/beta hydrolase [Streptosporangiaceae bacterium]